MINDLHVLSVSMLLCIALAGCNVSEKIRVFFEDIDPETGFKLAAAAHKVRSGGEGWDFFISIKSGSKIEIARSTITSLDMPDDIGSGNLEIVAMKLDIQSQKVRLIFKSGKSISVPVVLWIDDDL